MNLSENASKWCRISLGSFLIIYALNQFFHFFPVGYGQMPEAAREFIDSVVTYLPLLYFFEIIVGLLLIFNKWTAFILIVLFPLSVAFMIFNFANQDLGEMWPAIIVAILNMLLMIDSKEKYIPLFS